MEKERLKNTFQKNLVYDVRLVVFLQDPPEKSTPLELYKEVASLDDRITLEVHGTDQPIIMERYHVTGTPCLVVTGEKELEPKFYGLPIKGEFPALIETIIGVSRGKTNLKPETLLGLKKLVDPALIQVMISPDCMKCPHTVVLSHKFSIENSMISSESIDIKEFPHNVEKYNLKSVPSVLINGILKEGIPHEAKLLEWVTGK